MKRGSDVNKENVEVHRIAGSREGKKDETMSRAAGKKRRGGSRNRKSVEARESRHERDKS